MWKLLQILAISLTLLYPRHATAGQRLRGSTAERAAIARGYSTSRCQKESSSAERVGCAEQHLEAAELKLEKLVNERAAQLVAQHKTKQAKALRHAGKKWLLRRDKLCEAEVGPHPGAGLGWAGSLVICQWSLTDARLRGLQPDGSNGRQKSKRAKHRRPRT